MPREVSCPKCGQMLSVADNSPNASQSCPKCQAPIDVPEVETSEEKRVASGSGTSASPLAEDQTGKWTGTELPGVRLLVFRFLFPVLTVCCLSFIAYMDLNAILHGEIPLNLDTRFVTPFFFLQILVIVQILYWTPWSKINGLGIFLAVMTVLAAVIFLFLTCFCISI